MNRRTATGTLAALVFAALTAVGIAAAGPAAAEAPAMAMGSIYQTTSAVSPIRARPAVVRLAPAQRNAVPNQQALNELGQSGLPLR
ncbi:MAG TPA: hypothetical protein PLB21_07950 [Actinomycetota bacterium]|nr:hypothetical protein [Actinomycetota bacterium]